MVSPCLSWLSPTHISTEEIPLGSVGVSCLPGTLGQPHRQESWSPGASRAAVQSRGLDRAPKAAAGPMWVPVRCGSLPVSPALATLFSLVFLEFAGLTFSSGPLHLLLCPLDLLLIQGWPWTWGHPRETWCVWCVCPRRRQTTGTQQVTSKW